MLGYGWQLTKASRLLGDFTFRAFEGCETLEVKIVHVCGAYRMS